MKWPSPITFIAILCVALWLLNIYFGMYFLKIHELNEAGKTLAKGELFFWLAIALFIIGQELKEIKDRLNNLIQKVDSASTTD